MTIQHKSAIQELTNNLKESRAELETERKNHQKEVELRKFAESAIVESARLIDELKAKIQEMENNKPNPGAIKANYFYLTQTPSLLHCSLVIFNYVLRL